MGILNDPRIKDILIEDCDEELEVLSAEEFCLQPMYFQWNYSEEEEMKLRSGVIEKLRRAKKLLNGIEGYENYNLKIWDAFRSIKTQETLYNVYEKELIDEDSTLTGKALADKVQIFVSYPSKDSNFPAPHNTGGAVDLTIVDKDGKELEMGTGFDEFNEKSYTDHFSKDGGAFHENRMILKKVMEKVGFINYHEEWWHFSFGDQAWAMACDKKIAIYASKEL
jgi:zinc D-Ala-D-Ala dipeptidase